MIQPLQLNSTSLLQPDTEVFGNGLSNASLVGEPASLGLVSSLTDLSKLGRAILTSELLSAAETRRWLKPVTSTSNLRNAVGRPFEIYHYSEEPVGDEITDIYTKSGTVGRYSSYFGVVPSADVGFAIVAVDTERENPDLNAYADIMLYALLQTQELAYQGANETLVGTYHGSGDSSLELQLTLNDTGIAVVELSANGSNFLEVIAREAGIDQLEDLDLRLYPTGLEEPQAGGGKSQAFEGTIQDKSALADAGTPTCITWQFVGLFELNGVAVDRFIVSFSESGVAEKITWPAGGLTFER